MQISPPKASASPGSPGSDWHGASWHSSHLPNTGWLPGVELLLHLHDPSARFGGSPRCWVRKRQVDGSREWQSRAKPSRRSTSESRAFSRVASLKYACVRIALLRSARAPETLASCQLIPHRWAWRRSAPFRSGRSLNCSRPSIPDLDPTPQNVEMLLCAWASVFSSFRLRFKDDGARRPRGNALPERRLRVEHAGQHPRPRDRFPGVAQRSGPLADAGETG